MRWVKAKALPPEERKKKAKAIQKKVKEDRDEANCYHASLYLGLIQLHEMIAETEQMLVDLRKELLVQEKEIRVLDYSSLLERTSKKGFGGGRPRGSRSKKVKESKV